MPSPRSRLTVSAANVENLRKALARFPDFMAGAVSRELAAQLTKLKAEMVKRSSNPPGPIPASGGVHRQSGRLERSWGVTVEGSTLKDIKGIAGSFAAGKAPLLERGGEVKAPRGTGPTSGWIFIPTDANKFPSGQPIQAPSQVLAQGGKFVDLHLREFRYTFFRKPIIDGKESPAWNLLAANTDTPMFIMAKSANYRPQLGFLAAGKKYEDTLPGLLADRSIDYWREIVI